MIPQIKKLNVYDKIFNLHFHNVFKNYDITYVEVCKYHKI